MSQSVAGPSRRRRTYVIHACNSCRRRRCKCDGIQPVCGTCASSGHECSWGSDGGDGRPATKQYVESLRVKIQMLESEVSQLRELDQQALGQSQSSDPSPPASPFSMQLRDLLDMGSSSDTETPMNTTSEPIQFTSALPTIEVLQTPIQSQSPSTTQQPSSIYQYIFNIDTSIPTEQHPPEIQAALACQWNRHLPNLEIELSRNEHDVLLSRCFNYGTSWLSGMVPTLFLRDMIGYLSPQPTQLPFQYYSPILHCTLLSIATAFSDHPEINSNTTRHRFAAHAKQWLDDALSRPSPSHTLSLALLSEYHQGVGEVAPAQMYMGLSVRATRTPSASLGSAVGNRYIWATFIQEKLMALENKRPSETKVPRVSIVPLETIELGGQSRAADFLSDDQAHAQSSFICFVESCKLMLIAAPIVNNANKPLNTTEIAQIKHVCPLVPCPSESQRICSTQLDTWINALPDDLRIQASPSLTLAHVLNLHLWFWWIILELHLPVLSRAPPPAIEICDRATEQILELVATFGTQHGLRYFPRTGLKAVDTCGYTLLVRGTTDISPCVSALRTIASTWPCANDLADKLETQTSSL